MDTIYMWQNEVYSALNYEQPKTTTKITSYFQPPHHQQQTTQKNKQNTAMSTTTNQKQKRTKPTFLLPKKRSAVYYLNTQNSQPPNPTKKLRTTQIHQNISDQPHIISDSSTHIRQARQTKLANAFQYHNTTQNTPPTMMNFSSSQHQQSHSFLLH